jgi:hypothetical protein
MHTFDDQSYHMFSAVASEWVWGVIFVLWGSAHLLVIRQSEYSPRRKFALVGVWKWFALTMLYLFSNQTGMASCFAFTFAVASGRNYICLGMKNRNGQDARTET